LVTGVVASEGSAGSGGSPVLGAAGGWAGARAVDCAKPVLSAPHTTRKTANTKAARGMDSPP